MQNYDSIPKILVDSREPLIAERLKRSQLFEIENKRLEIGDVIIKDLVVERKAGSDFFDSLHDGRLFRQLIFMKRVFRRRLLLLENVPFDRNDIRQQGLITRITCSLQIPIIYTNSIEESAMILERTALQLFGFTTPNINRPGSNNNSYYQVYVLAGLPGIGLSRAKSLIAHFGSLQAVFSADVTTLSSIEGIGTILARQIYQMANYRKIANS